MVLGSFFYLVEAALWNGTYLHSKITGRTFSYLLFWDKVITSYIQPAAAIPRRPSGASEHSLIKINDTEMPSMADQK